jgi:hypothetical protein
MTSGTRQNSGGVMPADSLPQTLPICFGVSTNPTFGSPEFLPIYGVFS